MLFLLIAPAVVTYTWLQHRKTMVRKEVKWKMIAGIDKNELVLLKFSTKESHDKLKWKHSKEFEYNGEMYDIVERKATKDSIQYCCWWDHEETKLSKQLSKLLVSAFQSDAPSKDKKEQIVNFYKSIYFQDVFSWEPFHVWVPTIKNTTPKIYYKSISFTISLPPPENV